MQELATSAVDELPTDTKRGGPFLIKPKPRNRGNDMIVASSKSPCNRMNKCHSIEPIGGRVVRRVLAAQWRLRNGVAMCVVVTACAVASAATWGRFSGLTGGDPVRWLFEASRFAGGEVPYRDFMWMYPPLAVYLFGWTFSVFGSTFAVAHVLVCVISTLITIVTYAAAREMYGATIAAVVSVALVLFGVSTFGVFNLFSLDIYSPAVLAGSLGVMLCVLALVRSRRSGGFLTAGISVAGFAVASLSKQEAAVGAIVLVAATALSRGRDRQSTPRHCAMVVARGTGLSLIGPATVYVLLATQSGWENLLAGVSGYGVAAGFCPWWPTGAGVSGALAAAGFGAAVAAALAFGFRMISRERLVLISPLLFFGLGLWCLMLPMNVGSWQMNFSTRLDIARAVSFHFTLNGLLLPVQWTGAALLPTMVTRVCGRLRAQSSAALPRDFELLVIVISGLGISSRGLFSYFFGHLPWVSPTAYPLFLLAAPAVVCRFTLLLPTARVSGYRFRRMAGVVAIALLAVAGCRAMWSGARAFREEAECIVTPAGSVWVFDGGRSARLVAAVQNRVRDDSSILEIPWGGGMNFCLGRSSPAFSTQFYGLKPSDEVLERDLDAVRRHPPSLVIVSNGYRFGAVNGIRGQSGCCFPALRWVSGVETSDDRAFPVVSWIEDNYRPVEVVGEQVLLEPRSPTLVSGGQSAGEGDRGGSPREGPRLE